MSWGIGGWGISSWSGSSFYIANHVPFDNAINVDRLPTISFTIVSPDSAVNISTINLTTNGVQLIVNGAFTAFATGTIDNSDPNNVQVTANVIHAYSRLEDVSVLVNASNGNNEIPASGTTWQFVVENEVFTFLNHIVRKFERVLRINVIGLDAPQNPVAIVELETPELTEE
jgi:hypothetical protein